MFPDISIVWLFKFWIQVYIQKFGNSKPNCIEKFSLISQSNQSKDPCQGSMPRVPRREPLASALCFMAALDSCNNSIKLAIFLISSFFHFFHIVRNSPLIFAEEKEERFRGQYFALWKSGCWFLQRFSLKLSTSLQNLESKFTSDSEFVCRFVTILGTIMLSL